MDESDALPLALQGKLLTAIEAKRVRRGGAGAGGTQAELSARVATGQFRAELYHRLTVLVLVLPPLRDRGEDIVLLAQQFLQQYAEAHRLLPKRLSRAATEWLQRYNWPGNVRELSHLMERATLYPLQDSKLAILPEMVIKRDRFPDVQPFHDGKAHRIAIAELLVLIAQVQGVVAM